jgi:hypothetical protein
LDLQGRRFSLFTFFLWVRASVLVNIDLKRSDVGRLSRPDMAISFLILHPPPACAAFAVVLSVAVAVVAAGAKRHFIVCV